MKELTVDPHQKLSMQKHFKRSEYWMVTEGSGYVILNGDPVNLKVHDSVHIHAEDWHQLVNDTDHPLRVVEIQYGTDCIEEDIIRVVQQ